MAIPSLAIFIGNSFLHIGHRGKKLVSGYRDQHSIFHGIRMLCS